VRTGRSESRRSYKPCEPVLSEPHQCSKRSWPGPTPAPAGSAIRLHTSQERRDPRAGPQREVIPARLHWRASPLRVTALLPGNLSGSSGTFRHRVRLLHSDRHVCPARDLFDLRAFQLAPDPIHARAPAGDHRLAAQATEQPRTPSAVRAGRPGVQLKQRCAKSATSAFQFVLREQQHFVIAADQQHHKMPPEIMQQGQKHDAPPPSSR
jgi:hypothetical protein